MAVRLGDDAPNFTAETTEGTINFHEWLGNGWGILFSHPKDYTPVCTTELGTVAKITPEFKKRGVKVIAVSVDPLDSHKGWINDINETQKTTMNYPIIADPDKKVASLYDMIHPNAIDNMTVRSVFIIGPDKKVKLTLTYPASCGRNFDELLRVIDSLQLFIYELPPQTFLSADINLTVLRLLILSDGRIVAYLESGVQGLLQTVRAYAFTAVVRLVL
ncbi:MAG: peroxiredoxin [Nitrospirae bacterium]|nr:peroxiredoxin [Nitrospirota bacterium]